jgi:hypothetical protein
MAQAEYGKFDIAVSQLEAALQLYFAGGDRFPVITLAGAAEEILGRELQSRDQSNALDTDKAATSAISKALFGRSVAPNVVARLANRARNEIKHMDPGGARTVVMDPEDEANAILDRAILNYWRLTEDETPNMSRFLRERYSK